MPCSRERTAAQSLALLVSVEGLSLSRVVDDLHLLLLLDNKFQATMRRRLPELEKHQKAKVVRTPELAALLEIDFKQLALGSAAPRRGSRAVNMIFTAHRAGNDLCH